MTLNQNKVEKKLTIIIKKKTTWRKILPIGCRVTGHARVRRTIIMYELLSQFNNVFIIMLAFTSLNYNLNGPFEWAKAHAWFHSCIFICKCTTHLNSCTHNICSGR